MPYIRFTAFLVLTAICGGGVVLFELPFSLPLFFFWSISLLVAVLRTRKARTWRKAVVLCLSHATVMGLIVVVAYAVPMKTIERICSREIILDKTTYTLAELSEYSQSHREAFPIRIHIHDSSENANRQLSFTSTKMALGEFITDLERQTNMSHRFSCCGNAYTILGGPLPSFGLSFDEKALRHDGDQN